MSDLSTNTYTLYQKIDIYKNAEGEWKEPPSFPGITNAYYQALEQVKDEIKASLVPVTSATTDIGSPGSEVSDSDVDSEQSKI